MLKYDKQSIRKQQNIRDDRGKTLFIKRKKVKQNVKKYI